jgi:hypothetical protein
MTGSGSHTKGGRVASVQKQTLPRRVAELSSDDDGGAPFPHMTRLALAVLVPLAACSPKASPGCPAIERLTQQDAAADARAALARGDSRLLMLDSPFGAMGPAGVGVPNLRFDQLRIMEGTSRDPAEACDRVRGTAEAYATKYNQAIVRNNSR